MKHAPTWSLIMSATSHKNAHWRSHRSLWPQGQIIDFINIYSILKNRDRIFEFYFIPSSSCRLSRSFCWLFIRAGYGFSTVSPMVFFPIEVPVFRRGPCIEFECAAKSGAAVIWAIFLHWRRILIKAPIKQIELTKTNSQFWAAKWLHRCWRRMWETFCVGDKFEMLFTDLRCW